MSAPFEANARIDSAEICIERGFILTCWIHLEFDGASQGFGGFCLGGHPYVESALRNHSSQKNLAAEFISQVMAVAEVERFSDLRGRIVRVRSVEKYGPISAIGHPLKDMWFAPHTVFDAWNGVKA